MYVMYTEYLNTEDRGELQNRDLISSLTLLCNPLNLGTSPPKNLCSQPKQNQAIRNFLIRFPDLFQARPTVHHCCTASSPCLPPVLSN